MTLGTLSMVFEGLVSLLLAVMIFYSLRLNRQLTQMRQRETEMQRLIDQFNRAAAQAEGSVEKLRTVGTESERSLRACVDKAQSLRDDLMFMLDRGDAVAAKVELARSATAGRPSPCMPTATTQRPEIRVAASNDDRDRRDSSGQPNPARETSRATSQSERELAMAILSSRGAK